MRTAVWKRLKYNLLLHIRSKYLLSKKIDGLI